MADEYNKDMPSREEIPWEQEGPVKKTKGVYESKKNPGYQKYLDSLPFKKAFELMKDRTEKFKWREKIYSTKLADPNQANIESKIIDMMQREDKVIPEMDDALEEGMEEGPE